MMLLCGFAVAEGDPIVCNMQLDPAKLTGAGTVNVTITISNSGSEDLKDPVVLYDPAAKVVSDFGTNGAALLKAGETKTWQGTYEVSDRTLKNGSVTYYVKYKLYKDSGEAVDKSQPIIAKVELRTAEADIDVKRTITPTIAKEGQEVVVRYEITNSGTVDLFDVTIQEHKNIHSKKQSIPKLKPGQTADIKYPVKMGKKDLTSSAKITYKEKEGGKAKTYTVEEQKIKYGEAHLSAKLTADAKGVAVNGSVTLKLELKNSGSMDYGDIRVTDPTLGDVFTNQELKAGKTLQLEKEVTIPATTEYQFTVTATDATGSENSLTTDALTITAMDPGDALHLNVVATADRTEVFEQPGRVRFTIEVTNDSRVEAKKVTVAHGATDIYTFDSIPAGETRSLARDTALSMAGKFRFTVRAQDPLENALSFESNEMQIAFSVPTPAPATPTPAPDPTPEPTFNPVTVPPISDASVGAVPKTIQTVVIPITAVAALLLLASCVLLIVATKRRRDQKKASEAAVDHLERAKRRDYVTPAEEEELPEAAAEETPVVQSNALDEDVEEYELPHMKYARDAAQTVTEELPEEGYSAIGGGYYDPDMMDEGYDVGDYDRVAYPEEETNVSETADENATDAEVPHGENTETDEIAAHDDSMFRRPPEGEQQPRRSRRSRSGGADA